MDWLVEDMDAELAEVFAAVEVVEKYIERLSGCGEVSDRLLAALQVLNDSCEDYHKSFTEYGRKGP